MVLMLVLLSAQAAQACRYNIRDVGAVDLEYDSYYLFGYFDEQTPENVISAFEKAASAKLADTNVLGEMINVDEDPAHPAIELAKALSIDSWPAAVFVGPDRRSRAIEIGTTAETIADKLPAALEHLTVSPKRRRIMKAAATTYGVVLVIEGKDDDANAAARQAAKAAVKTIADNMDFLPKPIENPPVMITLKPREFAAEEVLLWMLNLKGDRIAKPHAAIFYGRARQIGPVLEPEEVTEDILTNILSLIGADCECGLDRKWMEGRMLPANWDEEMRAHLAKSLEFDPDNPMVKMEISRILRRGFSSPGGFGDMKSFGASPFGYQEIDMEFEDADPNAVVDPVETTVAKPPVEQAAVAQATETTTPGGEQETATVAGERDKSFTIAIAVLCVIAVAVVAAGMLIFRKAQN
ncbi:MAG: hypothetical protein DRP66_10335 [Planctomycetota bacterium]|nr:MAG: hypothetical protein DRP66_10335 [Planctomycetota bacterium]